MLLRFQNYYYLKNNTLFLKFKSLLKSIFLLGLFELNEPRRILIERHHFLDPKINGKNIFSKKMLIKDHDDDDGACDDDVDEEKTVQRTGQ